MAELEKEQWEQYGILIACPAEEQMICQLSEPVSGSWQHQELRLGSMEWKTAMRRAGLIVASPDLLAACKRDVPELANLAAMVDPELTRQLMDNINAIVAKVEGNEP